MEILPSSVGEVTKYPFLYLSTYHLPDFICLSYTPIPVSTLSIYVFAHLSPILEYNLYE